MAFCRLRRARDLTHPGLPSNRASADQIWVRTRRRRPCAGGCVSDGGQDRPLWPADVLEVQRSRCRPCSPRSACVARVHVGSGPFRKSRDSGCSAIAFLHAEDGRRRSRPQYASQVPTVAVEAVVARPSTAPARDAKRAEICIPPIAPA